MEDLGVIIQGCMCNNQKHQKMLYERFYGYALKVVFRYIYRYEKAVDVTNDGFVKLFRNFQKFSATEPEHTEKMLMGWMKRIMVNTAIDELRKSQMMPEIGDLPNSVWEVADTSLSADRLILYKELIALVRKLPPSYRIVFNMFIIDGFSHQEIAHLLGISVGACKSSLSKARAHLKNYIKKDSSDVGICNL